MALTRLLQMALAAAMFAAASTATAQPPGAAPPDSVVWSRFNRATFEEATRQEKPVFLLLTAPWNWDHFLLRTRYFTDPEVVRRLNEDYVPTHADVTVYPELREIHSLESGLVPSFHFLDGAGRSYGTFPPLDPEEFNFYLEDMKDLRDRPALLPRSQSEPIAVSETKFANRVARILLDRFGASELALLAVHEDLDPSALSFLLEYGVTRPHRRDAHQTVDSHLRALLSSEMFDAVEGGLHRAPATSDLSAIHREKLLRPNAEIAAIFASWYRMTGQDEVGAAALHTLQFLNRRMKKSGPTLYFGSMAADVYSPGRDEIQVRGEQYYRLNAALRSRVGIPPVSRKIPVGANFVLQQALISCLRAFGDDRMAQPARWSGDVLIDGAFEDNGLARRSLGIEGSGTLRDQGDAGSGLLAVHAVAGNRRALEAAERLADALVDRYWDEEERVFRNVDRRGDGPEFVVAGDPNPAWNGIALRFLAELAVVTRDERWREIVEESLAVWASRLPFDARGIGELGRAAIRVEAPCPLLIIAADPETRRGGELHDIAFRLYDRRLSVRWLDPESEDELRSLGVDPAAEPAIYLLWDRLSRPIGDSVLLRAAYEDARERVTGG